MGIGFNLYLVPWLLKNSRWQRLLALLLESVSPLHEEMLSIGIEMDNDTLPQEGTLPVAVGQEKIHRLK